MAFENEDAGNAASNASPGNDVGSLPTSAPAAPPIPVSPSTGAPSPAPARPAPQPAAPLPAHENRPTHSFAESIRHSLLGAAIAEMAKKGAGPTPVDYGVDASGRTVATPRTDTTTSRLQRIAESALMGMAAGAQIGPQKSAAAAWGAGIGAGARTQFAQAQQQDLLKRQQSQEEYEAQQKTLTDKAVRAAHNASTYSLWQKAMDEQNDHDPERKKNMDIVDSLNDYNSRNPGSGLQVQIVSPEAAIAMREQDAHSVGKHTFLPLGMTQAKDASGQPLFEADGVTPKQTGQIAVISGGKAGDMLPLPQSFVDDLKEYGKMAGIVRADQIAPGAEVPLSAFINMDKRLNDIKRKEIDGWKETKAGENAVKVGDQLMQRNTVTGKLREYGGVPNVEDKPAAQKVESDLKIAQTKHSDAETAKLAEETRQLRDWDTNGPDGKGRVDVFGNPVGAPGMDKKEYLKRVDGYTKDYSKDLNQLDAARSQLSDIIKNAEKNNKLPGADAVVGIFDAIGISSAPLKGRGFRINNSVVSEHVEGTRNAWQNMALKLSRLTPEGTGQIVSLEQLKDYERIMDQARHDAYVGAANDAVNRGIGIQFAPRGNGAAIDPNTMRIFLTMAKGDPVKASAIAKQYGWTPPR